MERVALLRVILSIILIDILFLIIFKKHNLRLICKEDIYVFIKKKVVY